MCPHIFINHSISFCTTLCSVVSACALLYHPVLYCTTLCPDVSKYALLYHPVSWFPYRVSCCTNLCRAISLRSLYHPVSCCTTLCPAVPPCIPLYHPVSWVMLYHPVSCCSTVYAAVLYSLPVLYLVLCLDAWVLWWLIPSSPVMRPLGWPALSRAALYQAGHQGTQSSVS